jgi:hypothetical protein
MTATILDQKSGKNWTSIRGDCVHALTDIPSNSVGFSVFSPPFGDLFVYSDSAADMGNSSDAQFLEQYAALARELNRVLLPGRLIAVHCSDLPTRKWKEGVIGLKPFSDQLRQIHEDAGMIYHCRVTIWRDPVVEMQRTKALGLLYKQLQKDSAMSRVGLADYLIVMRKAGDNPQPIGQKPADVPVTLWQQWASPVWMDINQTNVLNVRAAKDANDEKHMCPLQLDLIERAIRLWSNPGEVVLSPFMGIGSEGVVSLKTDRKFVGVELKESYWKQASRYLRDAENHKQTDLFAEAAA